MCKDVFFCDLPQLTKWNKYVETTCKPAIKEAGIGFDIENKSDGENSVHVKSSKRVSLTINGTFNETHGIKQNDWISNYRSKGCQLLPSTGSYLLAFEFESTERIVSKPKRWTWVAAASKRHDIDVKSNEKKSQTQIAKGKDKLFRVLKVLAKGYNICYDKQLLKNYEDIELLVECFDADLFQVR